MAPACRPCPRGAPGSRRSAGGSRQPRRPARRSARRCTSWRTPPRGRRPARGAGRGRARRTCCPRRAWRRAGGPASPAPRGPGPPAWDSRWSPSTGFAWARRRGRPPRPRGPWHPRTWSRHRRGQGPSRRGCASCHTARASRRSDPRPPPATPPRDGSRPCRSPPRSRPRHRAGPRTPPPAHRRSGCPAARRRSPAAGLWSPRPARPRRRSRTWRPGRWGPTRAAGPPAGPAWMPGSRAS